MSNASGRYTASRHCVYNISYHLWCPKYRRPVLIDGVDKRLKELLNEKAAELNIRIESMEVMPDYVHMFVKSNPIIPVHHIVSQFKGHSSRVLRDEFPWLRSRLPSLWTHSYYCESIGHISEETIRKYIDDQKKV